MLKSDRLLNESISSSKSGKLWLKYVIFIKGILLIEESQLGKGKGKCLPVTSNVIDIANGTRSEHVAASCGRCRHIFCGVYN